MWKQTMYYPNFSIGEDVYKKVGDICKRYGRKVVLIGGKTALEKASGLIKEEIEKSNLECIDEVWYGRESSYDNVKKLMGNESIKNCDMIFAIGGGKALDTCKTLGGEIGKPLFTFPTIASTCAATTNVCVIYSNEGVYERLYMRETPSLHTFINTKVIREAPKKYLLAGIGDTFAKGYEPEFASRGRDLDYLNKLGVKVSELCYKPLLEFGEDALKGRGEKAIEEVILAIILTTGIVSNHVENDYNSCVAHGMCYGFSNIRKVEGEFLHGELVAYGLLVQLVVDENYDHLDKLIPFYKKVSLPVSLKTFNISDEELDTVVDVASKTDDVKVACKKVTKDVLLEGIKTLENYVKEKF